MDSKPSEQIRMAFRIIMKSGFEEVFKRGVNI